jgi:hypothetical protein
MKRFCFLMAITVLIAGTVFGQSPGDRNSAPSRDFRRAAPEMSTINGTLQLEKGIIAVASSGDIYYVPMLTRYIGFIEGLKEGAVVSVEGYTFRNFIQPLKVTINGKSYDFAVNGPDFWDGRNMPRSNGRNFAPGCCGPGWGGPGPGPGWGFYGPGWNRR